MHLRRILSGIAVVAIAVGVAGGVHSQAASGALTVTDTWHLDRINQLTLPLDGNSVPSATLNGAGVDIYIVDTGINYAHEQFGGRAVYGTDIAYNEGSIVDPRGSDCDGHGSHVASLAGGTTVGVANGARLISVRVLDCQGLGEVEDVVAGLEWVADHHQAGRLAIANLSLGVDIGDDGSPLDTAVRKLVADGVVVVVAAGNGDASGQPIDACRVSPGDEPEAITVGAVTVDDALSAFSNFGACIDVFAPGGSQSRPLVGAGKNAPNEYINERGTSMATPLVAGYAALLSQQQPKLCPSQIQDAVIARATPNLITGLDAASPNRMLFLETSPISSVVPAGQVNNLVVSSHDRALRVSWDQPCTGGGTISEFIVSVYYDGKLVKKVTTAGTATRATVRGLRNGRSYRVSVRAVNELGQAQASRRLTSPPLRTLRVGQSVTTPKLAKAQQGKDPKWKVMAASRGVCAVLRNPQRLVAKSRGTCKVQITPVHAQHASIHRFTVQ